MILSSEGGIDKSAESVKAARQFSLSTGFLRAVFLILLLSGCLIVILSLWLTDEAILEFCSSRLSYRFALDFTPFLILLTMVGMHWEPGKTAWFLLVLSVLIFTHGVLFFQARELISIPVSLN